MDLLENRDLTSESIALTLVFGGLLLASLAATRGRDLSPLHNKDAWFCLFGFGIVACAAPNPFMMALIAIVGIGTVQPKASAVCMKTGWRTLAMAGTYVVAVPLVEPWMTSVFLSLVFVCGVVNGFWTLFSMHYFKTPPPLCTQSNINDVEAFAAIAVSCGAALVVRQEWWVLLPCIAIAAAPIAVRLAQGWGHLFVMVLAICTVGWGWGVWVVGLPLLGVGLWWRWNDSGWQSRLTVWRTTVAMWWRQGWTARLLGFGMGTWQYFPTVRIRAKTRPDRLSILTAAHNEFVQMLVEYGIPGAISLGAVCGYAAWRLSGDPLLIVGLTLVSVACVLSLWTLIHPVHWDRKQYMGSPSLVALSWAFLVVVDGQE